MRVFLGHSMTAILRRLAIPLALLSFWRPFLSDDSSLTSTCLSGAVALEDITTKLDERSLQDKESTNTCSNNIPHHTHPASSNEVIDHVLNYLDDNKLIIQSKIFQSYTSQYRNTTKDSVKFLFDDFRSNLEWMARDGVPNPKNNALQFKFYLGPDNCNNDGWQIGLINVAAFLSQAMTLGIRNDTCDELNWEKVEGNVYPLSNACGMRGWDYQSNFHSCEFDCNVDKQMFVQAVDKSKFGRSPPKLECYPRTEQRKYTGYFDPTIGVKEDKIVESVLGKTDIEGCCWWGRGALQTKGICNIGKLNYYLGKGAADDGRESRYKDINFCENPEAICSDVKTMEIRWVVALFEWTERVQSYDSNGWNYLEQLHKMADGDLLNDLKFEQSNFIDEVGSILEQGCPTPPCDTVETTHRLNWANERKLNFRIALESFGLPMKSQVFSQIQSILTDGKDAFEEVVLRSINPIDKTTYQSYRYQFSDFIEALRLMSDIGYDNKYFYIGQQSNGDYDVIAGLTNIAMFLSQAVSQSILEDACDEHNIQMISGKYPISNSCGQFGLSYQDMNCTDVDRADMTCPLDLNQSLSAVTRPFAFRAPRPFKCAPKSQLPATGFWDPVLVEENYETAYTNELGRLDVEGCCWWGRGVLRNVTRGRCFFGQLNYYMGKRAASEGRASLYPSIDFCQFPEAICASEYSHQLRWVSGMFHWIQVVQSFNQGGWSYLDKLHDISSNRTNNGEMEEALATQVDCLLKTGNINCDIASTNTHLVGKILSVAMASGLPTTLPTVTQPTDPPLVSTSPVIPPSPFPTITSSPSSSPVVFVSPSKAIIENIINYLEEKQTSIKSKILVPLKNEESIYTYDAFVETLEFMAKGIKDGKFFYIGGAEVQTRKRGLVNIAAFLAHVRTLSIETNSCDEANTDFADQMQYPLSNACGQYGFSYQDMRCHRDESFMECNPDPSMQMTGVVSETVQGQPPPFFCGPKQYFPFTGFYDSMDGNVKNDAPLSNALGRDEVEGCCWWGRGSARVTGVCMYGKLNYYLKDFYPGVDFCKNPGSICSGSFSFTLMWVTGMFVWIEYAQSDVVYSDALDQYVVGKIGDQELIDTISDRLDYGRNKERRFTNFRLALNALEIV